MSRYNRRNSTGFTLIELMVAIAILSVFSLGIMNFIIDVFRRITLENKVAVASQELKNALNLMSSELRMSRSISPYLPGDSPADMDCTSALSVSSTAIRFMVAHDDAGSSIGVQPYYVGYQYQASTNSLLRGQVAGTVSDTCAVPAGDPLDSSTAQTIVSDVVQIDKDGDGTNDNPFAVVTGGLEVNLGVQVSGAGGATMQEEVATEISIRAEEVS